MQLSLVGLSHKTAPIEIRERLYRGADGTQQMLLSLAKRFRLDEGMILSACNRTEVIGFGHSHSIDLDDLIPEMIRLFEKICLDCMQRAPSQSRTAQTERLLKKAANRLAHPFVSELKEGSRFDRDNLSEINFLRRVLERNQRQ